MRARSRSGTRPDRADAGFTLVEVIVALVLLAMVAVAVLGLFVRGVKDVAGLDRRQVAVAFAGETMELVRTVSAVPDTSGRTPLLAGRTHAAVDAQWAAAGGADLSQTDEAWDTTATGSSAPGVPLASTRTVSGVTFTSTNLIGTCWRPAAGGACVRATAKAASSVLEYRVVVLVTWSEGPGTSCSGSACTYALASLVDPGVDPAFNVNATNATWPAPPVLRSIPTVATTANASVTVDLSTAVASGSTPLSVTTGTVTQGATASVLPNTTTVTVTPASGYVSGSDLTVPFTITDPYGQSASGTFTVHVNAVLTAGSFAVTVVHGTSIPLDLAPYVSGGTGTVSYAVAGTSSATVTLSGSTVTYKSKNNVRGSDTVTYTVTTTFGDTATGTISLTVT
ncbi:MAG TPA: type II secretion system protein [Kineosporiaceae bacterium]